MKWWQWAGTGAGVFALTLSVINASWIAPRPGGKRVLVAHRGLAQPLDKKASDCPARHMLASEHDFIENSLRAFSSARHFGAGAVELTVQATKDGQIVAFEDETLECRTEGRGRVREHSLADLKTLDVGYGYTADGGKTFPLRGRGIGGMPTVEEVLRELPRTGILFNLKSLRPGDVDALIAAFGRAGVAVEPRFGFFGDPGVTRRLRQLAPAAWAFTREEATACLSAYLKTGWTSFVPQSCRNTTVVIPINHQWKIWGWPNRFLDRMRKAGTKVIMAGEYEDGRLSGIERPEQLGDVPRSFRGHLWIEDFYTAGRALQR